MTYGLQLVTRRFEVMTHRFELVTLKVELITRGFEIQELKFKSASSNPRVRRTR